MARQRRHPSPFSKAQASPGGRSWWSRIPWAVAAAVGLAAVAWKLLQSEPTITPPHAEPPPPKPIEEKETQHSEGRAENPQAGRETRDIHAGLIIGILVGMACMGLLHLAIVWWFFGWETGRQAASKESPYPLAPQLSTNLPPRPRLEQIQWLAGDTSGDVRERLGRQELHLQRYGATDEQGYVYIPIQEAMRLAAKQLPARKPPPAVQDQGLIDGGEPNSGRLFPKEQ